jgi:hypothetical protein
MTQTLYERAEDYLNGRLSDEETRRFEEDLLRKKEVAAVFRESLIMRELLTGLPPDEPPPGLIERIEDSLGLDSRPSAGEREPKRSSRLGQVFNGFRWGLRWPGYAWTGISESAMTMKDSFSGIGTVSYSLGPLQEPVRNRMDSIRLPEKPLWKIALSKLW